MSNDDPITLWMNQLRSADELAANKLWNHFILRLQELARKKLSPLTRRVYDEEDAALSAFHCVCAGLQAGRFPDLHDRGSLWGLMLAITSQKISNRNRFDQQQRRDVRRTLTDSVFMNVDDSFPQGNQAVSREPTPEFAAEFSDVWRSLFDRLADPTLRDIAALRLEGYTDPEISKRLNCSRRTVQRRLEIIRREWSLLHVKAE